MGIDGEELRLVYQDDIESTVDKKRCRVLATLIRKASGHGRFRSLFSEEVFCWEYFCDWEAMELGMLCVARLNGVAFYASKESGAVVFLLAGIGVWLE